MFAKDILLYDIESTGVEIKTAEPIQLAAILLDKNTLDEKNSFTSYIKADLTKGDPKSAQVHGITQDKLDQAPGRQEVARKFKDEFGFDVLLSSWVEFLDRRLLEKIMTAADVDFRQYDYHYLDLWPIAYTYLLRQGKELTSLQSEPIYEFFGLPERGFHDALQDCRLAALVLRKIMDV